MWDWHRKWWKKTRQQLVTLWFLFVFSGQMLTEGNETLPAALLQPKHGSHSQVSLKIRFSTDSGHGRWAAVMISDYQEPEYFIWRHWAVNRKSRSQRGEAVKEVDRWNRTRLVPPSCRGSVLTLTVRTIKYRCRWQFFISGLLYDAHESAGGQPTKIKNKQSPNYVMHYFLLKCHSGVSCHGSICSYDATSDHNAKESHHFGAFKTVGGYALFCVKHHWTLSEAEPGRSPLTCPGLSVNISGEKSHVGTLWLLLLCCYGPGLLVLGQSSPAGWGQVVSIENIQMKNNNNKGLGSLMWMNLNLF